MTRFILSLGISLIAFGAAPASAEELAYSRFTEGYWQIWQYDLATSEQRQLTHSPVDKREPVWGEDGAVLFHTNNHELYRVVPGADEAPFQRDSWPASDIAWSPKTGALALAGFRTDGRDASAIWVIGGKPLARQVLTRGPGLRTHPTWSPDGEWLVYVRSYGAEGTAVHRMARDGTRDEELLRDGSFIAHPTWSPDGTRLAYSSNRFGDYELVIRELASGAERRLSFARGLDQAPCWSPDGTRIAFTTYRRGKFEIWGADASSGDAAPLFDVPEEVRDPAWR